MKNSGVLAVLAVPWLFLHGGIALCEGWSAPEFIDFGWEYYCEDPKVVMDDYGNAFCAFEMSGDFPDPGGLYVNRYTTQSGWGAPERMDPGTAGFVVDWDIACFPGGDALVVYGYGYGGTGGFYARRFYSGVWGGQVPIITAAEYEAARPYLATGPNETAICVFEQYNGTKFRVRATHYDGMQWSSPVTIDVGGFTPAVAVDEAGNAICAFYKVVDGSLYTCASRCNAGEWSAASVISPGGSIAGDFPEFPPELAFIGEGDLLCATNVPGYSGEDPAAVYANRFSGGQWGNPVRMDGGPDGNTWAYPNIAVDGAGNALCVFTQMTTASDNHAYAVRFSGGTWGGLQRLDTGIYSECSDWPRVGFDGFGRAICVFAGLLHISCGGSADASQTYANYYESGAWAGAELFGGRGSLPYCLNCERPDLAVAPNGDAICVYQLTGTAFESRLYAVRYTAPAPPPTPIPTPTPRPTPTPDGVIRINFQPPTAAKPWIFLMDGGDSMSHRSGYYYGWSKD